ncbi:TPA: EexN family lipoprotein [Serratia fonticola]
MKKLLIVGCAAFMLMGCEEETKSKDWWLEHIEDAKVKVEECAKSGSDTDNCKNAKEAMFRHKQATSTIPTF